MKPVKKRIYIKADIHAANSVIFYVYIFRKNVSNMIYTLLLQSSHL